MYEVATQPPNLAGLRVLIVEDNLSIRAIVTLILEAYGADVISTDSAKEGLALLQQTQPRILISDIKMSQEDGYWLIRQVRMLEAEQGGQIPAIAMTAAPWMLDRSRALSAGFQWFVVNPFNHDELMTAVANLTQRKEIW